MQHPMQPKEALRQIEIHRQPDRQQQGEGLGRAVWNVMRDETPQLFWRSRNGNPINHFYYAESDGCYKQGHWKVFWYGIEDFGDIERCVAHCRTRLPTLKD